MNTNNENDDDGLLFKTSEITEDKLASAINSSYKKLTGSDLKDDDELEFEEFKLDEDENPSNEN